MIKSIDDIKIGQLYQTSKEIIDSGPNKYKNILSAYNVKLFDIETYKDLEEYIRSDDRYCPLNFEEVFLVLEIKYYNPPDKRKEYIGDDYWIKILRLVDNTVYVIAVNFNKGRNETRFTNI